MTRPRGAAPLDLDGISLVSPSGVSRRDFVRGLLRSGALVPLAPLLGAAGTLASAAQAEPSMPRTTRTRAAMAALADTVFPPGDGPGGAEAGFVELLFDPQFYEALVGFEVPIGLAVRLVTADLDRRARKHGADAFAEADLDLRVEVVTRALEGRLGLVYEGLTGLVKLCYFGGQRSPLGWQHVGYPGPAEAYPDAWAPGPAPAPSVSEDGNPA